MALVVSGLLNKQVGGELGISEITVKAHRRQVMRKMKADSLADLVTIGRAAWRAACATALDRTSRSLAGGHPHKRSRNSSKFDLFFPRGSHCGDTWPRSPASRRPQIAMRWIPWLMNALAVPFLLFSTLPTMTTIIATNPIAGKYHLGC